MKRYLKKLKMTSYGAFTDRSIGPFGQGLNVLYGRNEAGKSTITSFIGDILYGFADKRSATTRNIYEPISGKHAGTLLFAPCTGQENDSEALLAEELPLTRIGKMKEEPEGLREVCGDLDRETYEAVFALDCDEFEALKNPDVVSKMLAAQSGTRRAPAAVLGDVRGDIKRFESKAGGNPDSLWNLRQKRREVGTALDGLRRDVEELQEDRNRRDEVQEESRQISEDLGRANAEYGKLKGLEGNLQANAEAIERAQEVLADALRKKSEAEQSFAFLEERRDEDLPGEAAHLLELDAVEFASFGGKLKKRADAATAFRAQEAASRTAISGAEADFTRKRNAAKQAKDDCRSFKAKLEDGSYLAMSDDSEAMRRAEEEFLNWKKPEMAASDEPEPLPEMSTIPWWPGLAILLLGAAAAVAGFVVNLMPLWIAGLAVCVVGAILFAVYAIQARRKSEAELRHEQLLDGWEKARQSEAANESLRLAAGERLLRDREVRLNSAENRRLQIEAEQSRLRQARSAARYDAQAAFRTLEARKNELEALTEREESAAASFRETLSAAGLSAVEDNLDLAQDLLDKAQRYRDELKTGRKNLQEAQDDHKSAEVALGVQQRAREELFAQAGADDEEALAGLVASAEAARTDLQRKSNELATEAAQLDEHLKNAGEDRIGPASREVARLDQQLKDAVREYAKLQVEAALLEGAIEVHQSSGKRSFSDEADRLFSLMTDGRWTHMEVSEDGHAKAFNEFGESMEDSKLSLGTKQQMYLALRLALLLAEPETGASVPVLCDDILVNFDNTRRKGAARALAEVARTRQMLVFTCHEEVKNVLEEADESVTIINL